MTLALPARHNAVHSPALRRATPWCAMRPLFCLQTLQATGPGTAPGRALTCAFPHSPRDGSLVAVGGENKLVTIWDASGDVSPGRLVATLTGFTQRVNATAFVLHNAASAASGSPCVASVASDGYLRIHSFEGEGGDDGRGGGALAGARLPLVEVSAHEEAANGVDATHDGAFLVTCSDDATLKVRAAPPVALPGLTCFTPSPGWPIHSANTNATATRTPRSGPPHTAWRSPNWTATRRGWPQSRAGRSTWTPQQQAVPPQHTLWLQAATTALCASGTSAPLTVVTSPGGVRRV